MFDFESLKNVSVHPELCNLLFRKKLLSNQIPLSERENVARINYNFIPMLGIILKSWKDFPSCSKINLSIAYFCYLSFQNFNFVIISWFTLLKIKTVNINLVQKCFHFVENLESLMIDYYFKSLGHKDLKQLTLKIWKPYP